MKPVLIDTPVWLSYFRGGHDELGDRVVDLLDRGLAAACGAVLAEVMSEAATSEAGRSVSEALQGVTLLPATTEVFACAGDLSLRLRAAPVALPLSRLLVAATAIVHRHALLTTDTRMHAIARQSPLQVLCG